MKIKNFLKYFKEGVLKYFKISVKFLNISECNISSCIPNNSTVFNAFVLSFGRREADVVCKSRARTIANLK